LYIHGLLIANISNIDFIPSSNIIFVNDKLDSVSKNESWLNLSQYPGS